MRDEGLLPTYAMPMALLIAVALLPSRATAQLSPGPLSRAHASLDSPLGCTQCHGGRRESTTQRCLACHREIAWMRTQDRGYHAREGKGECASCHPDHAGRDFALIKWPSGSVSRFDHAAAGWPLEGKHRDVSCASCHTPEYRVSPAAKVSPREAGPRWVGLEQRCTSCHVDPHRSALGNDCNSCHGLAGWKPATRFDHDSTSYPLTGAHTKVTCDACHLAARLSPKTDAAGELVPVFKPVPASDCASCHADPHRGRLTGRCATCHVTADFHTVRRAEFRHDLTRYPLAGKHRQVACASCHVGYPATIARPPFATCAACHTDPHGGRATLSGKATDCAACHVVEGFTPSTFTVAAHQRTAFPLGGRHATARCASCHKTLTAGGKRIVADLRPAATRCADCHVDPHGSQLVGRADRGACEGCHTVAIGWRPSVFTREAHATLRLPLDGRHADIACSACHGPERPGLPALPRAALGTAGVAIRPLEVTCASCHRNPHRDALPNVQDCASCHGTRAFRPSTIGVAAHARLRFPLEGAHRAVPCTECHRELSRPARFRSAETLLLARPRDTSRVDLRAPTSCAGCHVTPHGKQFDARRDRGACESCHAVAAFRPASRFDHDRDTPFKLTPAHARVPCATCHVRENPRDPKSPVIYRGTVAQCSRCHGGTPR